MIGPPMSAPTSPRYDSLSATPTTAPTTGFTFLISPCSPPGVKKLKKPPWNSLEPDFVTALRTPPVERPYSGM